MSDAERLARILASIPDPADADWLLEQLLLPAWCRRMMRLQRRDQAIRALAAERYGALSSGRAIAETMHSDLSRRAVTPALQRILQLCGDRVPGEKTLRNALAGLTSSGGKNSPAAISRDMREPAASSK